MKPLIDLSQAAGKTVEKVLDTDGGERIAIHFTDGTAVSLKTVSLGYDGPAVIEQELDPLQPDDRMLDLGICSTQEKAEYEERRDAERKQRVLQAELAEYHRLKKQFEAAGGMPEPL